MANALESLSKARQIADCVSDLEQLYSVHNYTMVNREEFPKSNGKFLAALKRGTLWDGTRLPKNQILFPVL